MEKTYVASSPPKVTPEINAINLKVSRVDASVSLLANRMRDALDRLRGGAPRAVHGGEKESASIGGALGEIKIKLESLEVSVSSIARMVDELETLV